MCNDFKEVEVVSFLQIMDKKMDIFQYETLANPFLKKSLEMYSNDTNDNVLNVCSFIMKVNNNNIGLAFYNGYKNGKNIVSSNVEICEQMVYYSLRIVFLCSN
jgi:hypothetical protein